MKIIQINSKKLSSYKIFCDMDGVLTDFDKAADELFPGRWKRIYIQNPSKLWKIIEKEGIKFWSKLEWIPEGKKLWNFLKPYNPI